MASLAARAAKQIFAALAYRTGLLSLWWRTWGRQRRGQALIVMYHRVLAPDAGSDLSTAGIVVSTSTFERQLEVLARLFQVVPLRTAAASGDPGLCAITFDDGWADNHAQALPVLQRLGLTATVFVTTGFIGSSRLFWPERLAYLLQTAGRQNLTPGALDGLRAPVSAALLAAARAPDLELEEALDHLIEELKSMDDEEREQLLDLVAKKTGRDLGELRPPRLLNWPQVAALDRAGIEIGAHGVTHAILTRIKYSRAVAEICESRAAVADALGTPPESFAYPNGEATPELTQAVQEAGYARAVVADRAPPPGCLPGYGLRRKNLAEGTSRGIRGFSTSVFACEMLGLFDALRRGRAPATGRGPRLRGTS
jgi:peptidoglycan/xylan/chitin deacetylase (PgdA/CDA1 family)